jgi:hypothetical protein
MPCWIVDWWRGIAWWLVGPIPVLIVIALMLWAPRVRWQWLKILLRIIGGLAASFLIVVIGFGLLLTWGEPKPQYQTIDSPSGQHKATLIYQAGFLGRDSFRGRDHNQELLQTFDRIHIRRSERYYRHCDDLGG